MLSPPVSMCRPSGIGVSGADCDAVGPVFESRRRHGCIMPSRHGGTLNSSRAASPLVRLVEREKRWEVPAPTPLGGLLQNWGGTEKNRTIT
ncbi:hypothetical protein TNCV_5095431 [Trichonephila clavipes]|nr:hypothetical protein TNCV_5095431 [Trichonephila clavipes]